MSKDYGSKCPKCETEWTKTPRVVNGEVWVHCKPCNKKADDIIKSMNEINPIDISKTRADKLPLPDYMNVGGYRDPDEYFD